MKTARSLFVLLFMLGLSAALGACSRTPTEKTARQPVVTGFSCDMAGTYRDTEVAGQITRTSAGTLTVTLSKPAGLDGMELTWDGQDVVMNMLGLSVTVDPATIPESALGRSVLEALDAGMRGGGKLTERGMCVEGTTESGSFALYADPDTGALTALSVPSLPLELTFTNFQLK